MLFSIEPDAPGNLPYPKRSASDATSVAGGAVPIEVQDHHAVKIIMVSGWPRGYWLLSACPQVPAAIARLHSSGRFRCKRDRVAIAVPSVVRGRPAEVSILRLGGRRVDHEQANCRGRCPGRAHGVEEAERRFD
jgi:hypothetical protein